ncbi:MAG: hypothetical protein JW768_00655 [Chitinispirillaceae bacterium]|nr:hypothetical protein [Chitinispirillaceae bacterium]
MLLFFGRGGAAFSGSAQRDSLSRIAARDSLAAVQEANRQAYSHTADVHDPFSVPASSLFSSDAPGFSDAVETSPLCIPIRFGLSNRFNRFLLYGNTAPITTLFTDGDLIPSTFEPFTGFDHISACEIASLSLEPNNRCRLVPHPTAVVTPEAAILWENGVFDENVLTVRFVRPLSRQLNIGAFSHYRFFKGTRFDHEGNGIYSFYESLVRDTSVLQNRGYNFLANDYTSGIRTTWEGKSGNEIRLSAGYGDCEGEMPVDQASLSDLPVMSLLNQYRTTLDLASTKNRFGPLAFDVQGRFENSDMVRHTSDDRRHDGVHRELSCAGRVGTADPSRPAGAITYRLRQVRRRPFVRSEVRAIEHAPALETSVPVNAGPFSFMLTGVAGVHAIDARDSLAYTPSLSTSLAMLYSHQRCRLYAEHSCIPWIIPYDTALLATAQLLDRCVIVGGEVELKRGATALVLGCQSVRGVEASTVRMAWPEAMVPYEQPAFSFLAAPRIGPWHGFTVGMRSLISDRQPSLKVRTAVEYTAHPAHTREHIDAALCFDYWSQRDTVVFAGANDWNRPVYDLNCRLAVHIRSFRFFGKIDNLLNRRFAYVPGYYSPGVTFRWGIGWYLQK